MPAESAASSRSRPPPHVGCQSVSTWTPQGHSTEHATRAAAGDGPHRWVWLPPSRQVCAWPWTEDAVRQLRALALCPPLAGIAGGNFPRCAARLRQPVGHLSISDNIALTLLGSSMTGPKPVHTNGGPHSSDSEDVPFFGRRFRSRSRLSRFRRDPPPPGSASRPKSAPERRDTIEIRAERRYSGHYPADQTACLPWTTHT